MHFNTVLSHFWDKTTSHQTLNKPIRKYDRPKQDFQNLTESIKSGRLDWVRVLSNQKILITQTIRPYSTRTQSGRPLYTIKSATRPLPVKVFGDGRKVITTSTGWHWSRQKYIDFSFLFEIISKLPYERFPKIK